MSFNGATMSFDIDTKLCVTCSYINGRLHESVTMGGNVVQSLSAPAQIDDEEHLQAYSDQLLREWKHICTKIGKPEMREQRNWRHLG